MPFWSRRRPEESPTWDEIFPVEAMLRSQLDDVLIVQERKMLGRSLAFGGRLLVEPGAAVERLRPRLAPHGYTPFLREDDGLAWVHAIAQTDVVEPSRPLLHLGLFVATVITTLLAGAVEQGVGLWEMWAQPQGEPGEAHDEVLRPTQPARGQGVKLHHVGETVYVHGALLTDRDAEEER